MDYREFGRQKAGYGPARVRPTMGDLLIDNIVHIPNRPFALLNSLKKKYVEQFGRNRVKITYTKTK